jgi:hypothetical protein
MYYLTYFFRAFSTNISVLLQTSTLISCLILKIHYSLFPQFLGVYFYSFLLTSAEF